MTGRLVLAAVLAVSGALPASAQYALPPYAAAAPSPRPLSDVDQARDVTNRYGICIVKQHFSLVRRALALPDEDAVTKALVKLATDDCLWAGELRMSPRLLRGAVYRAVYLRDFGYMSAATRAALTPANGQPGEDVGAAPTITFGGCVARLSPDATRELVMADPATPQEDEAIAALRPALADCLPPKQQVRFNKSSLQALLSESLYKRTVALTGKSRVSDAR